MLQVSRVQRAAVLAIFALLGASGAGAQNAADSGDDPAKAAKTLREITVTAQKREEQLQEVPISITVVSDQLLRDMGARDIKDLQIVVPGLTVTSTANEALTTARIRGVGTVGDNTGLESSVGVVIDGVYRARNGVGFGDLGELERIEVLKGPQGTVFGKNTSAGIINVVTRKPVFETLFEGELTVGNYGALGYSGAFNTALGESAAMRVYATQRERDGFLDVRTGAGPRTANEDSNQDFHSVRGQLLIAPGGDFDINVAADYTRRDERCCAGVTIVRGSVAGIVDAVAPDEGVIAVADPFRRLAYSNRDTRQEIEDQGISAEANWSLPWFGGSTLTSITSSRDWQTINGADLDYSTADIWYRDFGPEEASDGFDTFTQELRLTGATDKVDWMFGAFYSDEDLERHGQTNLGSAYEAYLSIALLNRVAGAFPAGVVNLSNPALFLSQAAGRPFGTTFVGGGADDRFDQNARSLAVFTNNTIHLSDAFDLTAGLRYTREEKEVDSRFGSPNGSLGCAAALANPSQVGAALAARGVPTAALGATVPTVIGFMCLPWSNPLHAGRMTHQEREEDEWSGTLKAAYRWSDSVMGYVSAARGYKAGGFNLDRVQSSNGLTTGGNGVIPVTDTSFPAEFVDSYELGAKTSWLEGNLLLNGALFHQAYEDFQLNSFLGTTFVVRSVPEVTSQGAEADMLWQTSVPGLLLQAGVTYAETRYGNDLLPDADLFLLPGSRVSFAPLWSSSAALSYERPLGRALIGRFNIGAKYSSAYNTGSDLDPEKRQGDYTVVNARFGIGALDERWLLEFWAQNLTDEEYIQVGFDAPLQTGSWNAFLAAPRTYGATLRLKF
jgi:iron complex outermembrane recepter protein